MTSRIAIVGWGSLIWDLDDLTPKVAGGWEMRAGPRLPMEFSRVSAKRKRALAVCLDPDAGVNCATHVIRSARAHVERAAEDLAARERAPLDRIGWASADGRGESRLPSVVAEVSAWCAARGWRAAVWTDLEPNFASETGRGFSVNEGIAYLKALRGESLGEAHRYIRRAPPTTRTPLRRALAGDAWWRGLRSRSVSQA